MNVEEVLSRAKVEIHEDVLSRTLTVLSKNTEAPLTKNEQDRFCLMWSAAGMYRGWTIKFI